MTLTENVSKTIDVDAPIAIEIRRLRQSAGMTLVEFGAHVGLPWQTIAQYEGGRVMPPADRLLLILHKTRSLSAPFRLNRVARAVAKAVRAVAA